MDAPTIQIAVIALDGVQTLDVAGPMEIFAVANDLRSGRNGYACTLGSLDGQPIRTHSGLVLGPATTLDDLPDTLDTIIVAAGSEAAVRSAIASGRLPQWLRTRKNSTRRMVSVCTGAYLLAAAGLLSGRRATTHWRNCAELQALVPDAIIDPDAIFVSAPPIHTSAGVTTGFDLCLSLVEADFGANTALAVARELVLFLRRPGGQSQFSAAQSLQLTAEPRLQRLVAEILETPTGDLSVMALADRVGMAERSFTRAFQRSIGVSPARFVETARLNRAKTLLESSDWPMERIAERAGFGSRDGLFRIFRKQVGITPSDYRDRFGPARYPEFDGAPRAKPVAKARSFP